MESIFQEAQALQEQLVAWRRRLHQVPETGLVLPETAGLVKGWLTEMGLSWREYPGHSGLTVRFGNGKGRTVALRADMDGLAIQEETQLPFASSNGNMHACGHDAHTAMLLGAAKLLLAHAGEWNGTVQLIFQPGEEGPGGAEPMVRDGVLEGVDGIFALHIGDLAGHFQPGSVAVCYGNTFAADDQLLIQVKGLGGHGSTPDKCIDPTAIAALIVNNLQYIVSREMSPHEAVVVTAAGIEAGRQTYNVIPESACIRGTIRNASPDTRDYVLGRIREIAQSTARMMRAKCTVEFLDGYPALVTDRAMVDAFLRSARKLLPPEDIHILPHGILGGEDAAFFFREVPGCYFFLPGLLPCPLDGVLYGAHHPRFCLDESVFWRGCGLMAQTAMDWLGDETNA